MGFGINFAVIGTPIQVWGKATSPDIYDNSDGDEAWTVNKGIIYGIFTGQNPSIINGLEGQSDTSTMELVLPPDVVLDPTDQIEIVGFRYHVQGVPASWAIWYLGVVVLQKVPLKATQS